MNRQQKIILLFAVIGAVAMLLFPPFKITFKGTEISKGYGFLFDPPGQAYVNVSLLLVQWVAVFLVAAVLWLLLQDGFSIPSIIRDKNEHPAPLSLKKNLGLFRLWLIVSALFALIVTIFLIPNVIKEFQFASVVWDLPVECSKARGVAGVDYTILENQPFNCWYEPKKFRSLYPEYNDLSNMALEQKLNRAAGMPIQRAHPWSSLIYLIGIAMGVPFAVMLIGVSLLWANDGFKAGKNKIEA